jgi:tRNA modification GTPase
MIHPLLEDTIAAIATPNGIGAISIIRLSGNRAIAAADSIFKGKAHVADANSHTVHYGKIVSEQNDFIDDVLLTIFKAPNSYTGEDVVEISCHGNPLIGQKIIDLLVTKELRIAEPGEFTKRAFLNNRLDLAQAEAVIDVISSRTDASLRGARNQLDGLLSNSVTILRNSLLDTLSFLELELDFAEEDIEFVTKDELISKIVSIINRIDGLLSTYSFGRVIRDGVNVAIVGKPNVGKPSLLIIYSKNHDNCQLYSRTTRDVIREEISINGILFKLFDTAGIRVSEDLIEKEGVRRSNEAIKNSDLVLFVNDVEQGYSEDLYNELRQLTKEDRIITVMNKIDLGIDSNIRDGVKTSATTGEGIENLINMMKQGAIGNASYSERSAIVSNIRHFQCLQSAKNSLSDAMLSVNQKYSGEFVALDLRSAADFLGEIIGEITSEDVLNTIFSKFCIGK